MAELAKYLADKLYLFALKITEEDVRKRFIDRVRKLQLRKHRDTMLKDAKSVFPLSMKQYDQDIYLFNCKNGTLDLRTMEFREHRPEDFLTKVSPVIYDPDADCLAGGRSSRKSCRGIRPEQTIFRRLSDTR